MPIVFYCTCGKKLQAKEEQAGKRLKCPGCQKVVSVPGMDQPRPPLAKAVLAGKSAGVLPPLPEVPAFPSEDDVAAITPAPTSPRINPWIDRTLNQQSTPWQANDRERFNKGMEYREVPESLWIFAILIGLGGLLTAAWLYLPASDRKQARKSRSEPSPFGLVQGKITYKGAPLPSGIIAFHKSPKEIIEGSISPDGLYEIDLDTGEYQVTVRTMEFKGMPGMPNMKGMGPGKGPGKGPQFKGPPQGKGTPKGPPQGKGVQKGPPKMKYTPPKYVPIPAKYADPKTSGFVLEVRKGKQTFNIDLID